LELDAGGSMSKVSITFIAPLVRELDVDGTEVVVRTADMDQILQLLAFTAPLHDELAAAPGAAIAAINGAELADADKLALVSWLWGVLARHSQAVKSIVAVCTRQPEAFVGALLPDRLLALLLLSVEVNADFFTRMLQPLRDLAQGLALPGGTGAADPQSATSTGPAPSSS